MKRIAVITGASSGMGREFILKLNQYDTFDEVWAIARSEDKLEQLKNEVSFPVKPVALDLSKDECLKQYERLLTQEKPEIGLLINASGFGKFESVCNIGLDDNINMIDLNVRALTAMTVMSIPYMSAGSKIMEVASVAAFQPIPYINVYGATKSYVLHFARALNMELKPKGIHVMGLCPYWTKTKFFDRAVDSKNAVVKKYIVMYEPQFIVDTAYKALKKNKDMCIPGFIAAGQVVLCKLLPHKLVMKIWLSQQGLPR